MICSQPYRYIPTVRFFTVPVFRGVRKAEKERVGVSTEDKRSNEVQGYLDDLEVGSTGVRVTVYSVFTEKH